jgi:energy-converting hydrogenase B subunit D
MVMGEKVMNVLVTILLLLVAAGGLAVVLTRDTVKQALVFSVYGLLLGLLFVVLQAPDVALSQITVGSAALPLILLVTIAKTRRPRQ